MWNEVTGAFARVLLAARPAQSDNALEQLARGWCETHGIQDFGPSSNCFQFVFDSSLGCQVVRSSSLH
eukprot:6726303-Pyramimonas_sp.AAC.2